MLSSALSFGALNPFAYGLTSTLNADQTELTVNYSLNATATNVDFVLLDGDKVIKTVNLNAKGLDKGSYTATIALDDPNIPLGKKLTWKLEVKGAAHNTTNNHGGYQFYHPSGVDVDNNPESPHFGRIICNEAMNSVKSKTDTYLSAGFGAGIFAFNAAFEPITNGDKPGFKGGYTFTNYRPDATSTAAYAPRRVRISDDGRIFITSLNTDGHVLWEVDPDNLNNWTEVIAGTIKTGDVNSVVNGSGTYIGGPNVALDVKGTGKDLQLVMLSGIGTFQCNEYDLGTATTWNKAPSRQILGNKYIVNYTGTSVEYDNEGGVWFCQYRGSSTDAQPAFLHVNAKGEVDYLEAVNNVRGGGFRFNHDFTKVITADGRSSAGTYNQGYARIYNVSKDANGKPVLTLWKYIDMSAMGHTLNDFAWDIADNVYVVGNNKEWIRAYALARTADDIATTPCASKYAFTINSAAQAAKASELNPYAYDLSSELSSDKKTLTIHYKLNANGTYDQSAGYFAVEEGSTMTVVFKGNVEGKTAKMTKTFTGISAKQWRQIKFVQKKNEQGQATFDIVIQDLISDATLNNNIDASEDKIGEDPDAPKGDGGIKLDFNYADGCDSQLTDLNNMVIVPTSERVMSIKLKATVPNGILKFNVAIESSSDAFKLALAAADAFNLDLINPKPAHDVIFQVVPFPHGPALSGETEVAFDLSAAQSAITAYPGTHTFMMTIVDNTFCSKTIPVTMIVE